MDSASLSRREVLAGVAGTAVACVIPTQSAHPFIEVQRNRPRHRVYAPLNQLPEHSRAAVFRRRAWRARLEATRRKMYESAIQAEPGAIYRYLHFSWTHMHPYHDWPAFYAEQMERIAWAHRRIERPQMRPRGKYFVIDRASELEMAHRGLLGQIIVLSGGTTAAVDEESGAAAGAFAVDVDNLSGVASDMNNGIWDDDGPWATWAKFASELESGFSVGDTLYMRAGDYVMTALINPTGGGTTTNASKILWTSWPGERANIDMATNDDTGMVNGNGNGAIVMQSGNYRCKSLDYTSRLLGFATELGTATPGCEFIDLVRTRSGTSTSAGNSKGVIAIENNSDDHLVEGCDFSDGNEISGGNGNTVYLIESEGVWRGNLIEASGTTGGAWHLKRMSGSPSQLGALTLENSLIYRTGSGTLCVDNNNMEWAIVQHNIFDSGGQAAIFGGESAAPSEHGGTSANSWYRNQLLHNTTNGPGLCTIDDNDRGDTSNNGTDNVVYDNICTGAFNISVSHTAHVHNTDMDYNLYTAALATDFREYFSTFNGLAAWQAAEMYFGSFADHDDNSQVESPIDWAGTPSVADPTSYALDAMSAGSGAGSDMTDMGADTSLVGPGPLGY